MEKITHIDLYKVNIPEIEPFKIALDTIYDAENIFVLITTDSGRIGYGECSPFQAIHGETQATCYAIGQKIAKLLIGHSPTSIEHLWHQINRILPGNFCIKSAFDMALFDLASQIAGLPLYAFLGGKNDKPLKTDMTVGIDTPKRMAEKALQFKNDGFYAIKVKLGTQTREDIQRIATIREAIGYDIPIRVDANQGWSPSTAIATLNQLVPYQIEYCEAPISRKLLSSLPYVRNQSPIPIMADESLFDHFDALQLIRNNAVDFFNIKLGKSGGIFQALKITAMAEAASIPCQVGCFSETRLGITALAHFVLAKNIIQQFDMDSPLMLVDDPIIGGIEYLPQGQIQLSEAIGLGAIIDERYLEGKEKVRI